MSVHAREHRRSRVPGVVDSKALSGAWTKTGLIGWYDFSDITTLFQDAARTVPVANDGDPIGGVTEKGGGTYHATQGTDARRPTYKVNIKNGLSIARFSAHALITPNFSPLISQPYDFFIVTILPSFFNYEVVFDSRTANTLGLHVDATNVRMNNGVNLYVGATANQWFLLRGTFNGASSSYQLDDAAPGSGNTGSGATQLNGLTIGAQANQTSYPVAGDIGEILQYNRVLTDAERIRVRGYLNTKWAIF